jgi:gamma-F420-2:alpha-L-glutamate ligase
LLLIGFLFDRFLSSCDLLNCWIIFKKIWKDMEGSGSPAVDRLLEVAKEERINARVVDPDFIELLISQRKQHSIRVHGVDTPLPDCIITRIGAISGYRSLVVVRHLEKLGIPIINSSASIDYVRDKLYTLEILAEHNLPVPDTILAHFPVDADVIEEELGFPVVVKAIYSERGRGVHLCETREKFLNLLQFIESTGLNVPIIIQEFIATSKGHDLRVFTLGNKILGAMDRIAKEGSFKTNYSSGGTVHKYEMNEKVKELALKCTEILGLEIAGVDILFDHDEYKICEVNAAPGFKGLEKAIPGLNIAKEIYDYFKQKMKMG